MLDFVLGALIVALAIRGWWRGLVREAIALGVVVVGLVVSFRLSSPAGDVVASLGGTSPEVGRLIAGVLIFLAVSVGAGITSAVVHKGLRFVPGLPTLNRVAGAGFSVLATIAVATIALTLLTLVSPPEVVASQIEGSAFAGYLTDPGEIPQKAMGVVSGDRSLERLLTLQDVAGVRRIVADDEVVLLSPADAQDVVEDVGAATDLLEKINRNRDASGADPVVATGPLSDLALRYAIEVYVSGRFVADGASGTSLDDRLAAAGIPVVDAHQVMALAVTAEAAQEALAESAASSVLLDPDHRFVGIAVVEGPLGALVVEVLAW